MGAFQTPTSAADEFTSEAEIAEALAAQQTADTASPSWVANWGLLLRTARQISGFSLTQLSTMTGLSKSYLSKLESGASGAANPSRATLAALARALPSFRPLAHTLEPGAGTAELNYGDISATSSTPLPSVSPTLSAPAIIHLGWRELEVLVALIVLEGAAVPFSVTAPMLARATDRELATITRTMDVLGGHHLVEVKWPTPTGSGVTYRCADDALARLGVARLGDLLMLAAALLAGASSSLATPHADRLRTYG